MENKRDYISQLQVAIQHLHNCAAHYIETTPVLEEFQGQTVWDGEVEVFALHGHPQAKRCYAWSHLQGQADEHKRFVTVLELPPVESPITAVRASIMADRQKRKDKK